MNISRAKRKLVSLLLRHCVRRSGFKDVLLKQFRTHRLQYPEWNNNSDSSYITPGVDFTFIEYCHKKTPPSHYIHDVLNRAVYIMESECHASQGFRNVPKELKCIYDYNNHYLLLTAIADAINAEQIIEIGTASGTSLWSWLRSSQVKSVSTWDIFPIETCTGWFHNNTHQQFIEKHIQNDQRWIQYVEDLTQEEIWRSRKDLFAKADIIFIDGPHDGNFENVIFQNILKLENKNSILLIFDDIHVSSMVDFWCNISLPKLDATSVGHQSGTGLAILLPHSERYPAQQKETDYLAAIAPPTNT